MRHKVDQILGALPPYEGEKRLIKSRQDTFDIVEQLLHKHSQMRPQYDRICIHHWSGNGPDSAADVYRFLKQNAPYRVEPTRTQTTKSPAAILREAWTYGNDCKHYASYAVGVGEALQRLGYPIKAFYRFASYDPRKKNPGHVFAVWICGGKEYWIDPVPEVPRFNSRYPLPQLILDKVPNPQTMSKGIGSLYDISGINQPIQTGPGQQVIQITGGNATQRMKALADPRSKNARFVQPTNKVARFQQQPVSLQARKDAAFSGIHWLDDIHGEDMGKLKFKLPKIQLDKVAKKVAHSVQVNTANAGKGVKKIAHSVEVNAANAGKGVKKVVNQQVHALKVNAANAKKAALVVAMAPSRQAFLTLLRLNVFDMAVKWWKAGAKTNNDFWRKVTDKWKSLGGQPSALLTAVKNGVGTHNKLHPKQKVSGFSDSYDMSHAYDDGVAGYDDSMTIGEIHDYMNHVDVRDAAGIGEPISASAVIAAATPVLVALMSFLKQSGVDTSKAQDVSDSEKADMVDKHDAAVDSGKADADGTVTHSDGTQTQAITTPDGGTGLAITNAPNLPGENAKGSAANAADDGGGDDTSDTDSDTGSKTPAKKDGDGFSFKELTQKVGDHLKKYKWVYIGVGGGTLLLFVVLPRLMPAHKSVTKRRTR